MTDTPSQNAMIRHSQKLACLRELKRRGREGMTARDAQRACDCDRFAARVKELREDGHPIKTFMETNRRGKRYGRYVYTGKRAA